jgi:multiple sugar transport system substrate-binding protein
MHEKAKDAIDGFLAGRVGRRELVRRMAALGVGAATTGVLLNEAMSRAYAADFDMMANKGTAIKLLLNKHPYADAMIADLDNFKKISGIDVSYDIFPEDVYFDKVTAALSSRSTQYDAFMTGAYQTWQYGPAGWAADLAEYINDPAKTAPAFNWTDVLPGLRASTAWSGKPGDALGGAGAHQWCIPWGFEANNVTYNREILDAAGVTLPKNLPEMVETTA